MTKRGASRSLVARPLAGEPPAKTSVRNTRTAAAPPTRIRAIAFGLVAAGILGVGIFLAFGVFFGQRDGTASGAISMRISMAGFGPNVLEAKPGQTLTIDWWNSDGAMHLENGVHTLVSDSLGVRLALPAQSRKTITLTAPMTPGDYDFWCDSCCGGKDSPDMHGTLRVKE